MSQDIYGAVNRHYGSEPNTERDESTITAWAVETLMSHGECPGCHTMDAQADTNFDAWAERHAQTCERLRERVVNFLDMFNA